MKWVADFYVGGRGGRRVRESAPTRKLAEAIERDAKVREFRGELEGFERREISLAEFIDVYRRKGVPYVQK